MGDESVKVILFSDTYTIIHIEPNELLDVVGMASKLHRPKRWEEEYSTVQ